MNEDSLVNRSLQGNSSPSGAGGGTVDMPPTVRPGETIDEPSLPPDAVGGKAAPAAELAETLDGPPVPAPVDLMAATMDGDPGAVADSDSFQEGSKTVDYERQDSGTPLPAKDAVKGGQRSYSWLGSKGAKSGEVSVPATVAGYEVLGVLGRGAMGVVYKARQRGLHRVVALKMILAGEHAGERELARFQIEAEAVARLQHPNIVQIYEVGEEEGKPYFSLEFVDGGNLIRKLNGEPQPPTEAARLLHQLAIAMHAAHEKNIIHRDLKPANILLMADGTPKISDFGLAKRLEEDAGQTNSGAILGTPSYMSPEQADGNTPAIGPLSDVYSLGVILFEALTGRVPFRSPTILETLMQVKTREPVAPTLLQPKIPRDLETICLKCLQKDPKKRYASAASLAEDLRRFLNKEPILARPVGRIERGWRWCQRNPLGAAILLLLVVWAASMSGLAAALNVQKQRTEEARIDAEEKKADAIQARDAAEKARKIAVEQTQMAIEQQQRADREGEVAKQRHEKAVIINVQLIEEMLKSLQSKNLLLHAGADLHNLRLGLQSLLGDKLALMARELEGSGATSFALLSAHQHFGDMLQRVGRTQEALQRFQQGTELARKLAAKYRNSDKAQGNLSVMVKRLGDGELEMRSNPEAARRYYLEALRLYQDIVDHPRNHDLPTRSHSISLSHSELSLGRVELDLGHPSAARAHFVRALELRRQWWSDYPDRDAENSYLSEAWMWRGVAAWHEDDEARSRDAFAKAIQLADKLIVKNPEASWKADLAEIQGHQGDAWLHLGKLAEARKSYAASRKNLEAALATKPDEVRFRILLAQTDERQAALAAQEGQRKEAETHYQAALSLRRELLQLDPNRLAMQNAVVLLQAHCGQEDKAAANVAVLLQRNPKSPLLLLNAARCYAACAAATAKAEARKTYTTKAVDSVRKLLAVGYAHHMVLRTDPDLALLRKEPAYLELLATLTKP